MLHRTFLPGTVRMYGVGTLTISMIAVCILFSPNPLPRFLTKGNLDYFSFLTKFIVMLIFYLHL